MKPAECAWTSPRDGNTQPASGKTTAAAEDSIDLPGDAWPYSVGRWAMRLSRCGGELFPKIVTGGCAQRKAQDAVTASLQAVVAKCVAARI